MTAQVGDAPLTKDELATIVARDIEPGSYVNLGIGQPVSVAEHFAVGSRVVLHSENGMLNMGPAPDPGDEDHELINAAKQSVTQLPGASYFDSASSFAMMRGGHLDVCVMGAFQVAPNGDFGNWHTGAPDAIPAVGGAMDLAIGAKKIYVMMSLFARDGAPKLVPECPIPLTGVGCVNRVYTDYAVFDLTHYRDSGTVLVRERFGISHEELSERVEVPLS